ncbi:MAG: hypothetical protein M1829_004431 [Trizodia sp. TS-e1964]|nr:MAG: hypothetical protein M1829_004431 [Trizodia sp. TS-e1964]
MYTSALFLLITILARVSAVQVPPVGLKAFYLQRKGKCYNELQTGFRSSIDGTGDYSYCGDVKSRGMLYISSKTGDGYATIGIDCNGITTPSGTCSGQTHVGSAFADILKRDGFPDLNPDIIPYVSLGNRGTPSFNPQDQGIEPLSIVGVLCGSNSERLVYGIWGDVNSDSSTGKASRALFELCYPDLKTNPLVRHVKNDVLYLAFTGKGAVPSAPNWNAKTPAEFERSIKPLGDKYFISEFGAPTNSTIYPSSGGSAFLRPTGQPNSNPYPPPPSPYATPTVSPTKLISAAKTQLLKPSTLANPVRYDCSHNSPLARAGGAKAAGSPLSANYATRAAGTSISNNYGKVGTPNVPEYPALSPQAFVPSTGSGAAETSGHALRAGNTAQNAPQYAGSLSSDTLRFPTTISQQSTAFASTPNRNQASPPNTDVPISLGYAPRLGTRASKAQISPYDSGSGVSDASRYPSTYAQQSTPYAAPGIAVAPKSSADTNAPGTLAYTSPAGAAAGGAQRPLPVSGFGVSYAPNNPTTDSQQSAPFASSGIANDQTAPTYAGSVNTSTKRPLSANVPTNMGYVSGSGFGTGGVQGSPYNTGTSAASSSNYLMPGSKGSTPFVGSNAVSGQTSPAYAGSGLASSQRPSLSGNAPGPAPGALYTPTGPGAGAATDSTAISECIKLPSEKDAGSTDPVPSLISQVISLVSLLALPTKAPVASASTLDPNNYANTLANTPSSLMRTPSLLNSSPLYRQTTPASIPGSSLPSNPLPRTPLNSSPLTSNSLSRQTPPNSFPPAAYSATTNPLLRQPASVPSPSSYTYQNQQQRPYTPSYPQSQSQVRPIAPLIQQPRPISPNPQPARSARPSSSPSRIALSPKYQTSRPSPLSVSPQYNPPASQGGAANPLALAPNPQPVDPLSKKPISPPSPSLAPSKIPASIKSLPTSNPTHIYPLSTPPIPPLARATPNPQSPGTPSLSEFKATDFGTATIPEIASTPAPPSVLPSNNRGPRASDSLENPNQTIQTPRAPGSGTIAAPNQSDSITAPVPVPATSASGNKNPNLTEAPPILLQGTIHPSPTPSASQSANRGPKPSQSQPGSPESLAPSKFLPNNSRQKSSDLPTPVNPSVNQKSDSIPQVIPEIFDKATATPSLQPDLGPSASPTINNESPFGSQKLPLIPEITASSPSSFPSSNSRTEPISPPDTDSSDTRMFLTPTAPVTDSGIFVPGPTTAPDRAIINPPPNRESGLQISVLNSDSLPKPSDKPPLPPSEQKGSIPIDSSSPLTPKSSPNPDSDTFKLSDVSIDNPHATESGDTSAANPTDVPPPQATSQVKEKSHTPQNPNNAALPTISHKLKNNPTPTSDPSTLATSPTVNPTDDNLFLSEASSSHDTFSFSPVDAEKEPADSPVSSSKHSSNTLEDTSLAKKPLDVLVSKSEVKSTQKVSEVASAATDVPSLFARSSPSADAVEESTLSYYDGILTSYTKKNSPGATKSLHNLKRHPRLFRRRESIPPNTDASLSKYPYLVAKLSGTIPGHISSGNTRGGTGKRKITFVA